MDAFHAKPIEKVQEISAITYGFMASRLFAALEFDLFTHIALVQIYGRAGTGNSYPGEPPADSASGAEVIGAGQRGWRPFRQCSCDVAVPCGSTPGDFRDYVRSCQWRLPIRSRFATSTELCVEIGYSLIKELTKAWSMKPA